jgi:hypothetical protein
MEYGKETISNNTRGNVDYLNSLFYTIVPA